MLLPLIAILISLLVFTAFLIGLVVYFDPKSVERRCLARVKKALPLLDQDLPQVRRTCTRVHKTLERLARGRRATGESLLGAFPDDSTGLRACLWAEVLRACADHREGLVQTAEESLNRIRQRFGASQEGRRWLLEYYLFTGKVGGEAVQCYLEAMSGPGSLGKEDPRRDRVYQRVHAACEVRPGMSQQELRDRVQWNHSAQKSLSAESWPLLGEAQAWFQMEGFGRARRLLETAVHQFPGCPTARMRLARVCHAMGEHDRAYDILAQTAEELEAESAVLVGIAEHMAAVGRAREAVKLLERVPDESLSASATALAAKGRTLLLSGRSGEGVALLERAHASALENSELAIFLADLYGQGGKHDEAVAVLNSSIPAETDDREEAYAMACALWNCGQYGQAADWFRRCARRKPDTGQIPLYHARCLLRSGEYAEARAVLRDAKQLSQEEAAEAAFYTGVALYRDGDPGQGLTYFIRAYNLARKADLKVLAQRAGKNALACYHGIARANISDGMYLQAAKALEVLRRNLDGQAAAYQVVTENLAECYVHACVASLRAEDGQSIATAIGLLEKAIQLRPSAKLRGLLVGLYARQKRYQEAVDVCDQILTKSPQSEAAQLSRAICELKTAQAASALTELARIAQGQGRYAVRAALVLSAERAADKRFDEAAATALRAVRAPGAKKDPYYGAACCQVVLCTFWNRKVEAAKQLATRLLGGGETGQADAILGTLLAHEGHFEEALPYLENGVPATGRPTVGSRVLSWVYRQIAARQCEQRDFRAAAGLLRRASARDNDPQLRQFAELTAAASQAGHGREEINEETVHLLSELYHTSRSTDPMIVRAVGLAYQLVGRELTQNGRSEQARAYWHRADILWVQQIARDEDFWREYIDRYNEGKQYLLTIPPAELRAQVFRRMAGLHLSIMRDALVGKGRWVDGRGKAASDDQLLDEALNHWNESRRLVGEVDAPELFDEVVQVDALVKELDPNRQPDRVYRLLEWVHKHVSAKEEYVGAISNLAFRQAIESLKSGDVSTFLDRLDVAAAADAELQPVARKAKSLGRSLISQVLSEVHRHPIGIAVRDKRPDMYGQVLLRAVMVFANSDLPFGFGPQHVRLAMNHVMTIVTEDLRS